MASGSLGTEGNDRPVLGLRSLFDRVANDIGQAAAWKFQLVARAPLGFVRQAVVKDKITLRPALEQMADVGVMEIAAGDRQLADRAHVEVVALTIARPVVPELAASRFQARCRRC